MKRSDNSWSKLMFDSWKLLESLDFWTFNPPSILFLFKKRYLLLEKKTSTSQGPKTSTKFPAQVQGLRIFQKAAAKRAAQLSWKPLVVVGSPRRKKRCKKSNCKRAIGIENGIIITDAKKWLSGKDVWCIHALKCPNVGKETIHWTEAFGRRTGGKKGSGPVWSSARPRYPVKKPTVTAGLGGLCRPI